MKKIFLVFLSVLFLLNVMPLSLFAIESEASKNVATEEKTETSEAKDEPKEENSAVAEISEEYPYLEFKTTSITPYRGYKNWSVSFRELQSSFGSITNAEPGVVVMNCFENLPKEFAKKQTSLMFYFYNFKANFQYIKMVKQPDNYITVSGDFTKKKRIQSGDKVKFTVHLKDTAEEVVLKLLFKKYLYTIRVNGSETIELTPEDKDQKIWSCQIPVKSLVSTKGKKFKKGEILMRALVLGGSVKEPIWTPLQYSFE